MEIDAFKERKREMQLEIFESVKKAMLSFKKDTGYTPHTINVWTERIATISGIDIYIPIEVSCDVEIQ